MIKIHRRNPHHNNFLEFFNNFEEWKEVLRPKSLRIANFKEGIQSNRPGFKTQFFHMDKLFNFLPTTNPRLYYLFFSFDGTGV
jgi:hypothetical protein